MDSQSLHFAGDYTSEPRVLRLYAAADHTGVIYLEVVTAAGNGDGAALDGGVDLN